MVITTRLIDTETNRRCLTTSQARKISGLSGVYLTYLLRNNILEGFKEDDREWFIYADSLEQFLSKTRKPGPRGPRTPSEVRANEPSTNDTYHSS